MTRIWFFQDYHVILDELGQYNLYSDCYRLLNIILDLTTEDKHELWAYLANFPAVLRRFVFGV